MIDSLSSEELQFIKAVEKYKSENSKHFLSWTEVLKIFRSLGYKKSSKRPQGSSEGLAAIKRKGVESPNVEAAPEEVPDLTEARRAVSGLAAFDKLAKYAAEEDLCKEV